MTGALSIPFTVLAFGLKPEYARAVWGILAGCSLFATVYQVWAKERRSVNKLECLFEKPDVQGTISNVRPSAPENYPDQTPAKGTEVNFILKVCNHSSARTNIMRVILIVSIHGRKYETEASASRPTGAYRPIYPDRTAPIMMNISSVILEHRITEEFRGYARFRELSPDEFSSGTVECIAFDSSGEYRLPAA